MKKKIVISGLIYPFTMLHYFWRAFERRAIDKQDIEIFVLGPFTGTRIPWKGGMDLPQKYVKHPDLALPKEMAQMMPPPIMAFNNMPDEWQEPDLWIQIDAGWRFQDRPLPRGVPVAHIQTDPHVLKSQYKFPKAYSDFNFCMQGRYLEEGEFFLPYGYDPTIHYPEHHKKIYDACLIGLQYEHRSKLVNALRRSGLNVFYETGLVYDEYRQKYNESKIALSWSSLEDTPARVYEAMAMGVPLVANRTPDISNFFVEGDHYLGFNDVGEAVKKVEMLLEDDDKREEMANKAYRKVESCCKWDYRVNQLLETCGLA